MSTIATLDDLDAVQRELRLVLPNFSKVVTLVKTATEIPDLDGWHSDHIMVTMRDGRDSAGADVSARVEQFRAVGFDHVLVPADVYAWLDRHREVRRYLAGTFRRVPTDQSVCHIFALQPLTPGMPELAEDGLPIPPTEMIGLVAGGLGADRWFEQGGYAVAWIREMLDRNGVDLRETAALLDFGCGCGRIIRHWPAITAAQLSGSDYNPRLVEWCREHLPTGRFEVNDLVPPLPFEDDSFDLVYSLSIFTHLDEPLHQPWFDEIARVVRPDGVFLLTFQGRSRLEPGMERAFDAGELIVWHGEHSGASACSAWHPESYVRELARNVELLEYSPGGALDIRQDAVLFRKPEAR